MLYDAFGKTGVMKQDWGYATFIEYAGKRILFDSGNDRAILAANAKASHVDLSLGQVLGNGKLRYFPITALKR